MNYNIKISNRRYYHHLNKLCDLGFNLYEDKIENMNKLIQKFLKR